MARERSRSLQVDGKPSWPSVDPHDDLDLYCKWKEELVEASGQRHNVARPMC